MGIALFRFAMGSPAGVANAALPRGALGFKTAVRLRSLPLARKQVSCPCAHRGNASGVVTAVLQLPEALQELVPLLGNPPGQRFRTYKKSPAEAELSYEVKGGNQ